MKYEITKSFRFEAGHSLPHLPKGHQCRRWHGHSYEVIIGVTGPVVNEWVQDYAEISAAVKPLIDSLDHQDLNELLKFATTAENLAQYIWRELEHKLPMLSRVEIRETPTSNVILTKSNPAIPRWNWRARTTRLRRRKPSSAATVTASPWRESRGGTA